MGEALALAFAFLLGMAAGVQLERARRRAADRRARRSQENLAAWARHRAP